MEQEQQPTYNAPFNEAADYFTGLKESVDQALRSVLASCTLPKNFRGTAIYMQDPQHQGQLAVISQTNPAISEDHQHFVEKILNRRRLVMASTSVGDTIENNHSGIYDSKMADHTCLNLLIPSQYGASVVQFVASKATPEEELRTLWQEIETSGPYEDLKNAVYLLSEKFGRDISERMYLDPPDTPNGAIIRFDISGFKNMMERFGDSFADDFATSFLYQVQNMLKQNDAGYMIREEGDGAIILSMDFDRVYETAQEIKNLYNELKKEPKYSILQGTAPLKTSITSDHIEFSVDPTPNLRRGDGTTILAPVRPHANRALTMSRLMLDNAERDRDVILIAPDTHALLAKHGALPVHEVPFNGSTFIDHVYATTT